MIKIYMKIDDAEISKSALVRRQAKRIHNKRVRRLFEQEIIRQLTEEIPEAVKNMIEMESNENPIN